MMIPATVVPRTAAPEPHQLRTRDDVPLRLTRLRGGSKGPVLVVHGVGVWSGMFSLPTVRENFAQYLVRHGYDVWLFDWRGSIQLPVRQFMLDQAAENDFPAAVRYIREATRAESIQAVVHCAGSAAFFAALASGLLPAVRCVAASQVAMHFVTPWTTRIKAFLHLSEALAKVFLYGHLYEHAQLNQDTHDRLTDQFGKRNITAFVHLAQLARRVGAQRFDYGPAENRRRYGTPRPTTYLDAKHLRIPITFVSGERNRTFVPRSTELTFEWLCKENGPKRYRRHVVPGYGHIDSFMGANANRDVYPLFLEQLDSCPT